MLQNKMVLVSIVLTLLATGYETPPRLQFSNRVNSYRPLADPPALDPATTDTPPSYAWRPPSGRTWIREALAPTRTSRQDIVVAGVGGGNRLALMFVQLEERAIAVWLLDTEDCITGRMGVASSDVLVNAEATLKRRTELEQGFRPQQPAAQIFLDTLFDARIGNRNEASDVGGVVVNHAPAQLEHIHVAVRFECYCG